MQPYNGIIQVKPSQLLDFLNPIEHGSTVDKQSGSSMGSITITAQILTQTFRQIGIIFFIILFKLPNRRMAQIARR